MQFNQPYFGTGFNNGAPFFPLNTSFAAQCVQSPEVVGEGEVVSLVLPDGNVQLFFLPTNKWCAPFITIPNKSSCWFVKSVANPVPHPTYFQNQFPSGIPSPRLTLGYSGSFEVPTPFKFHSDGATSTTDIHYFFPRLAKLNNATKLCTGVQVVVPGQNSSCQSEAVSCIPSNCGQHNCSCCNRKCDNKGAFNSNREISSQGDTKNRYKEDLIICKRCAEPKVKRISHSQTSMSIDETSTEKKIKKEKKDHSQPKKQRSTHSQTSMSIDEPNIKKKRKKEKKHHSQPKKCSTHSQTSMSMDDSKSEIRSSRSKKEKRDTRKTNECRKVKSRRRVSGKCSCTSIRNRKGHSKTHTTKNHTSKDKKINRASNTDFVRCTCSDISLSSSKSVGEHDTREQNFDNSSSSKHSINTSSEMECQFCESCIYSSSDLSASVSQTDTSHGMSVDEEIKGNRKNLLKSDVGKKNEENRVITGGMTINQEMKHQENNKKIDKTSVTCVCLYPASDESLVKNTPPESDKPLHLLGKNIANCSSKPHDSLDKMAQLSHNKSSNTGPIYIADADFCECFSNLIQPSTRDKTFKEIEKDLKRSEKAKSSKTKEKKEKKLMVACKCSKMLYLVHIATQASKVLEKNTKPMSIENKENTDFRPKVDCNSSKAVQSRETGKQLCGNFGEVCCCVTPDFGNSSPVDANSVFNFNKTTPLHYRASCILDTAKHTPYIPNSNSV
ncbi:uncharacterized protein LOC113234730 [Hyposmocoma kahamanoa]|uniref:uncharacterized protein LOC113234730 n=1 Tax=Hyposmocoma kahamanoa TaxID=1477025 RepID=UPI000E6D7197|nr:uncharacterized protein LOC113234730 [Hyposmocoma kahamanoa]